MPDLTGQAATFRAGAYRYTGYIAIIPRDTVLTGTIDALPTYPTQTLSYTLDTGATADVERNMHIVVYDSTGVIKGLLRVASSGTISATSMPVNEFSIGTVDIAVNDTFSVFDEYRIEDKLVAATAAFEKDSRIAFTDQTANPPPVANAGGLDAGFVDTGQTYRTVDFDASAGFVVDPDSSSLTYLWDVGDGTITVGTTTTAAITVTFPVGHRHVKLTTTDAQNSESTERLIPVWVYDQTTLPVNVIMQSMSYSPEDGLSASFEIADSNADIATLPNGALIVYFEDERYAGTANSYGSNVTGRSHIKFVGYLTADTVEINAEDNTVTFEAVSPLGILNRTGALPQLMISATSPADWQDVKTLTVNRALHYLAWWHATFMSYFDFVWLDSGDDKVYSRLAVENIDSIGGQLRDIAQSISASVTCDRLGRILIMTEPDYMATADRTARTTAYDLTTADVIEISMTNNHRREVKFVRGEGITTGGVALFSNSPGDAPGMGPGQETLSRQIVDDHTDLNTRTGLHYARVNGLYNGLQVPRGVRLTLPDGYDVFDPAYREFVTLTLPATTNRRGLAFTSATRWTIRDMTVNYDSEAGAKEVTLTIDHETDGATGVTYIPPVEDIPEYDDPPDVWETNPSPPTLGITLGKATDRLAFLEVGGNVYRCGTTLSGSGAGFQTPSASGGPVWVETDLSGSISGTVQDSVQDAFDTDTIYVTTTLEIGKISNLSTTPTYSSLYTFVQTGGDPRTVIETNSATSGFVVVARAHQNVLKGLWAVYSTDSGSSWTETQVGNFDWESQVEKQNSLYVSAITSGKAYMLSALDDILETTDSGTTWTAVVDGSTGPNVVVSREPAPGKLHVPYDNVTGEFIAYWPKRIDASGRPHELWRTETDGVTVTDLSPTLGGVKIGPRSPRSIDSTRDNRLNMAFILNQTGGSSPTIGYHLYTSTDGGDSMTRVAGEDTGDGDIRSCAIPSASSIYVWGDNGYIKFYDGATLDDRSGNLATLNPSIDLITNIYGF